MDLKKLHPRDQIVTIITRIYNKKLTAPSGGNLSIIDDSGNIWITPSQIDKGTLGPEDIIKITPDGKFKGKHKPSSEYPIHMGVYRERPDIKSIVHAHPATLVSFSLTNRSIDQNLLPKFTNIFGQTGYGGYAVPGSEKLGEIISTVFKSGKDSVMMENHGIVTSGKDILEAYYRMETLEFYAKTEANGLKLGTISNVDDVILDSDVSEAVNIGYSGSFGSFNAERKELCDYANRSYLRGLTTASFGTLSLRIRDDTYLYTQKTHDKETITPDDTCVVNLVNDGNFILEAGKKIVENDLILFQKIYQNNKTIASIGLYSPPAVLAFAISDESDTSRFKFDSRTKHIDINNYNNILYA